MTSKTTITLYGNVGADPETRTIPGRQVTKEVYDPIWKRAQETAPRRG